MTGKHTRDMAFACPAMLQCYLVKSLAGKYFYKLQKCRLLANSKCASMKKLYGTAGA